MIRLNQLVTRLLILALIGMAAWIGRAYVGKQAMVYHLQSYVGARVDVKDLHIDHSESRVFLNLVEVASPTDDRKNLLQFEAASLQLDFGQLMNRRIVIEDGRLSEVKFAVPRTTSGRLPRGIFDSVASSQIAEPESQPPAGLPRSEEHGGSYPAAQRWRDSLVVDVNSTASASENASFEIGPVLKQKTELWANRFHEPNEQLIAVNASLAKVEEILSVPVDELNPLRLNFDDAIKVVDASLESLERVGASINEFESQSQKDVYELSQVQMRDRQSLLSNDQAQDFDGKLINELLVGEVQRQLVGNGLDWFQQFRNSLPDPATDFRPVKRGRDIMFGVKQKPKLAVKNLQVDGSSEFANSHFKFAGTIENIVDDPTASELPMKFNLRAQGDPQVVVSGTVDRTAGQKVDTIRFTGHAIPQPAYTLGSPESIQVSMTGDSRLHVDAELHADSSDRISGTITFSFEDVTLHADSVHRAAGGAETAARLNETVSNIHSFRVTSTLGGTIYQPTSSFASDLGPQVASSLESVFSNAQQLVLRKREHQLNRTLDGELVQFKEGVTGSIAKLNKSWRASYSRTNRLKKHLSVASRKRFPDIKRR